MVFDIKLRGQQMIVPSNIVLAAGARNSVSVRIDADEAWDGLTMTLTCRTVYLVGIETHTVAALTPETGVVLPHENMIPGALYLGVTGYGADGAVKLTTAQMVVPIKINPCEDDTADPSTEITPALGAQILAYIGLLDSLTTDKKNTIVAAINELAAKLSGIVGTFHSALQAYPSTGYTGLPVFESKSNGAIISNLAIIRAADEEGVLEVPTRKLVDSIISGVLSQTMKSFERALAAYRDGDTAGLPVMDPDSDTGFSNMILQSSHGEGAGSPYSVPTLGSVELMLRNALAFGYVDVTEDYENALAAGQVNGAREYLWTLGAGRYSLAHESGWLYLEALAGIDQGNGSEIGMVLYDVGEFLTISVYGNIGLSDQPIFRLDGETGEIWCYDKKLHVYDGLIFKDRKLFLSARKTPVGDGVEFPKANLAQTDPSAGNYVEGRELLLGNVKTVNGQAPDDKGNVEISIPEGGTGGGLTKAQINALDAMFKVCAFIKPDVSAEYNAFITAFATGGGGEEPEPDIPDEPTGTPVVSISVTYIGGDVAVGTALTALTGITVTATYSDGSTANVSGYTLSGTIAEGDNIITVSFGGKVAMFTVVGIGVSTGVSNEVAWADGVAYDYALVSNHYVDDKNGALVPYNGYNMTPYLYCNGASKLRIQMKASAASVNSNAKYNAFYDADKNFIQNINYSNMMDTTTAGAYCDIDIPTNASYFVMSHKSDALKYVDFIPLA